MKHLTRWSAVTASLVLPLSIMVLTPPAQAAHPVPRGAVPVVKAHMTHSTLRLSTHSVHAGQIMFKATAGSKEHILQILRLHRGYSPKDFQADIGQAFQGNTDAIARVDDKVSWLSGATARPGKPGWIEERLKAGHYVAIDQEGNGFDKFTVTGKSVKRTPVRTHGAIITYTYGFDTVPGTLPASGWVKTKNRADQPHFIELQRVKAGTTRRQVTKFIKAGGHGNPSWILKAGTGLGVLSPGRTGAWRLDLPRGRYLLACFWPDRFSGMPHFLMGMYDLVNLR
jgi:hypothetical protein